MGESRAVILHRTVASLILSLVLLSGLASLASAASGEVIQGSVLETMDSGGYTYVRVATPDGDVWAAGPRVSVEVGDTATFGGGMPMFDFHSKGLDRDFEEIYFVGAIRIGDESAATPHAGSGPHGSVTSAPPSSIVLSGIVKAEGGVTVGVVYAEKSALAGKEIVIRAKVVKSNSGIMGKNWLHVRDGTAGPDGENDLTVTTSDTAEIGDTVIVRGKLATNKDFGMGYRYDVILEDATVSVEGPST